MEILIAIFGLAITYVLHRQTDQLEDNRQAYVDLLKDSVENIITKLDFLESRLERTIELQKVEFNHHIVVIKNVVSEHKKETNQRFRNLEARIGFLESRLDTLLSANDRRNQRADNHDEI